MDNNPSPGNKAGGLTTILEKSLGAVAKAGGSPLIDVVEYAEPITERGLVFMDSPGFDPCSATGQVASGATHDRLHHRPRLGVRLQALALDQAVVQLRDLPPHGGGHRHRLRPDRHRRGLDRGQGRRRSSTTCWRSPPGRRTKSEALGYGGAEFVPWQIGAVM